ncbi:MAG TPA: ATP-binding protein [Flavisolibacter sp.]|nr:ATP-binding protein [Flavisolibacter sp.]
MDTHETSLYTTALIVFGTLGVSIIYFVVSIYRQQRYFLEQQRMYFTDDINLLERERSRTAHDLHDEIGPLVTAMRTRLQLIKPAGEKDAEHIKKIEEYARSFLKRMREIAINLSTGSLAEKGLEFALRQMLENVQEIYAIRFRLVYRVETAIDVNSSIHLYRIVREIIHNTIKHAGASEMRIQLQERKGMLYLACSDNGSGFVAGNKNEKEGGMGRSSLQSRTIVLKGSMDIQSEPGKGTQHVFKFPFPKQML